MNVMSVGNFSGTNEAFMVQALAIKKALEAKGLSSNVYVGMRYWYPFTEEAIQQVSSCAFFHFCILLSFIHLLFS